ncbi:LCP family protein [Arthrobacter gandavensis]|uniref:LCP family protein n=1 Tax=Arthrobacter gandavensis TaxID=169960 RepID=UPI00188F2C4B|nr:LCP family protein [Arthrobacter gandavensis]MBF4995514.1 LCP family protein [Arthrobacter gandavensis]
MTDFFSDVQEEPEARRRHPVRVTILVLLVLVLLAGAVAGGYVWNLARTFNDGTQTIAGAIPENSPEKTSAAADSRNILLIGSDTREPGADARSDTMMLVHVPGDRSAVYVMSIMRDTWTEIPGHGEAKINAAMALGGVPLMVETVQGLLGVPIDHVAVIDFEGFEGLTEALGGVEVDNAQAFQSHGGDGEFFDAGRLTLQGDSALKFVRERYAFADGDYQRVRNQQAFLRGLLTKLISAETLGNPVRLSAATGAISPYLSVDEQLDAARVGELAVELRGVRAGDIEMFTLPNAGVGTSADGQSIVVPDEAAMAGLSEALKSDGLAGFVAGLETATG